MKKKENNLHRYPHSNVKVCYILLFYLLVNFNFFKLSTIHYLMFSYIRTSSSSVFSSLQWWAKLQL
jgi:hypothetical protein